MTYLMALDEGTTSCRTIIFDAAGKVASTAQHEFQQYFTKPGWVEHDALEIRDTQFKTMREALEQADLSASDIASIGITNQRETVVLWDRQTGEPLHHAIVWQDRRTADDMARYDTPAHQHLVRSRTGLRLDPYFSATKLAWMLDHADGARAAAQAGQLAFGTIDSWLLWNLTGGAVHATDVSNACRTLLYNLETQDWDSELLALFDIPASLLPEVRPCSCAFGTTTSELLGSPVAIGGMIGDQQSALFGQACLEQGMAKTTYGTGCFLLMNTGEDIVRSSHGLLSTVAWQLEGSAPVHALEGSIFMGGASIQWLRDGLGIIDAAPDVNALAGSVADNGGVVVVPAFAGMGAPIWDPYARASIQGLTRGSTAGHIALATLEGIACQVVDLLHAMEQDSGVRLSEVRVDGGAAASDLLMQIQADLLDRPVLRPEILETTAMGAAFMAGLSAGIYSSDKDIAEQWSLDRRFQPVMEDASRASHMSIWHKAVERSKQWVDDEKTHES
ncbi:MAG: glycerol kinase GlpK [Phycisphaerales bacterium]|nr:glycerol kinase GlpK [Phycisphaerales bacterium]